VQERDEAAPNSEPNQILMLGFSDNMEDDVEDYTHVVSRRKKRR
jgi:hypothetical protein